MELKELQNKLLQLNVNDKTETINQNNVSLTYLSWADAWCEMLKVCPNATYEIKRFTNSKGVEVPYMEDDMGYMVMTSVTVEGVTREMWLPVLDSKNKTLKKSDYSYTTKYGSGKVEAINMFNVNKAIMRCLAKNLAMFGLGLYIYRGEDLPEKEIEYITQEQIEEMKSLNIDTNKTLVKLKLNKVEEMTKEQAKTIIEMKKSYDLKMKEGDK